MRIRSSALHYCERTSVKFQAANELSHFSFSDCALAGIEWNPAGIQLTLEALIVLPENSRNTNLTKSYASPIQLHLIDGQLIDDVKEGYPCRDANGKLLESVPGTMLSPAEIEALLPTFRDVYLSQIFNETRENGSALLKLDIELPQTEEFNALVTPSYRIGVRCEKAVFGWDYYTNHMES